MKILVYCGLYHGYSFKKMIDSNDYDLCYGFEANTHLIPIINSVVGDNPKIKIINCALSDCDGYANFKISSNEGQSSSLVDFNPDYDKSGNLYMKNSLNIKTINLLNFLKNEGVDTITDYVSDLQGYDYKVLSTLKPLIDSKKIKTIQCEVHKSGKNVYSDVNNSIENFEKLLESNYNLISTGWGHLTDGVYNNVPDEWWEFDAKWSAK